MSGQGRPLVPEGLSEDARSEKWTNQEACGETKEADWLDPIKGGPGGQGQEIVGIPIRQLVQAHLVLEASPVVVIWK